MDFKRPPGGFRFHFGGTNVRDQPDAIGQNQFAAAENIRSTGANSVRTRPGYVIRALCGNTAITDLRAYTQFGIPSFMVSPDILLRDQAGNIWLAKEGVNGNATLVTTMANDTGGGVSMVPFRPNESPVAWMYIAGQGDYKKISPAPGNNNATAYNVGIAEPQFPVDAGALTPQFIEFTGNAANWNASGTAGNATDANRATDSPAIVAVDNVVPTRYSLSSSNANAVYAPGQTVFFSNNSQLAIVQQVLPKVEGGNLAIQAIAYQSGNNGLCVIVPQQMPLQPGPISAFQRGSLIQLGGGEIVMILGLIPGPSGTLAFQTSTSNTHAANESIVSVRSIVVDTQSVPAGNMTSIAIASNMNTGVGLLSRQLASNPFMFQLLPGNNTYTQNDDYFHASIYIADPTLLTQILVMFNLDAGNFNSNVLYASVRPSDFANLLSANSTVLDQVAQGITDTVVASLAPDGAAPYQAQDGNNQWFELMIPISSLSRLGSDPSLTLANVNAVGFQVQVSGNTQFQAGSIWIGGGGQPDVGNNGAPYGYVCVPLSSNTGVRGNPTPLMRYGVSPRRQPVLVKTSALNSSYDAQIDTWEIYRYGGSIFSYRFEGTVPVGGDFIDNYFDDAVAEGNALVIDNTQPWPSVDQPWSQNNNLTSCGPILVAQNNNSFPATITRWLPGTIFQVNAREAYTLRSRPVLSNNATTATFEFQEAIAQGNTSQVFVLEPNVAAQPLPYTWGPSEEGYVFGCGDFLRPGTVSFAKAFSPDAAPTANTLNICPPSEPLLGGEVLRGLSLVASSARWWALYFQSGGPQRFKPVEVEVGKRLAAPWGKCTDGSMLYFWATDCIARTNSGAPAESLTDQDLYSLFPHGGLSGKDVTRGKVTYYAPDYRRNDTFRIAVRDGILYALYADSTGTYRMLVGEIAPDGVHWISDRYASAMTAVYAIEQPYSDTNSTWGDAVIAMGNEDAELVVVKDKTNDGGGNETTAAAAGEPITGFVYTREWDANDPRGETLWGDSYVSAAAPSGMTVTPVTSDAAVASPTTIARMPQRQFVPISLGGGVLENFLGLQLEWTDDFNQQSGPTTLYLWEHTYADKPEIIQNRFSDWVDFGSAQYVRGVVIHANTYGVDKAIAIRNGDTGELLRFSGGPGPGVINHDGEQTVAYYFEALFVAHMVRDESQDDVDWQNFGMEWIKDPWPELTNLASSWLNFGTTSAKFLQGLVLPLNTNGPVKLLPAASIAALQPNRTMALSGTNRTGAMGGLVKTSETGFTISTVFRDQADFCKLTLFDADDFFGHIQTTKYLPNFDFTGCVLSFDVAYKNLFPLESYKFASINQTLVLVEYNDATATTTFDLRDSIVSASGARAARIVFTVNASPSVAFDRVQLWYQNIVFDYVSPGVVSPVDVAAYLVGLINLTNWPVLIPTIAIVAEANGPDITVWAAVWGVVDVLGAVVSWVSGEKFFTVEPGSLIVLQVIPTLDSVPLRVLSVDSPTQLTLTVAMGTLTNVTYAAPGQGSDGNSVTMYALHKTSTLTITPIAGTHMTGGQDCTSLSLKVDFSSILTTNVKKVRRLSMVFAAALRYTADPNSPALAAYVDQECEAVFSNWSVANAPPLRISGPDSVLADSSGGVYAGGGWSQVDGFYYDGFAQICATTSSTVTVTYNCGRTHDVYLSTVLYVNCGIVTVSIDGGSPITVDCYILNDSQVVARRLLATNLRSGLHSVTITVTGTKNAASSGVNFTFDYIQAVVATDPQEIGYLSPMRSSATDYDTQHGYALSPQRLIWMMRMLGLTGDWEHYIGAFFWPNRKRYGGSFSSATVTFTGTFSSGDGFGGSADQIFIVIAGTTLGKTVFPQDTNTTIAAHFAFFVNELFVGVRATSAANVLTITLLSPINGFTITESFTPVGGSTGVVTLAGSLVAAAEGMWELDESAPGINSAATAWHDDFLGSLNYGQTATVAFSQELATTPDNPPTSVWRQRYNDNTPVQTGTALGTAGLGYITNVSGNNLTVDGHGYRDGYTVNVYNGNNPTGTIKGTWMVTVQNNNVFTLGAPVGTPSGSPANNDAVISQWQSDQMAFSSNVGAFLGAGQLAMADIFAKHQMTPQIEMGEVGHWFFAQQRFGVGSIANNGGLIRVNTTVPHGWSNNWTAILPLFDANNNLVQPNAAKITVTGNNSFVLQGSNYNASLTPGPLVFGGGMGYYDADQKAQANNQLGRPLAQFYTQDDDPTVNNSADALFLAERITAYQNLVQAPVFKKYPSAIYELLWPEDVNRPGSPFSTPSQPFPQGGRMNAFVNLPNSWKQQNGSGFNYFKTEALSWSATYDSLPNSLVAMNFATSNLNWNAANVRYLIAWLNGNCYWQTEYNRALPLGLNWYGFWAFDQMCLMSRQLPLEDATQSGVTILIKSSDGNVVTLPPVVTGAAEKTAVPFSFTPIVGHEFQIVPLQPLRYWPDEIVPHWQPTPELAKNWITQWTAFGIKGFKHIPRIEPSYQAQADVTLTIEVYDGTPPMVITLPATNGVTERLLITTTFNKGQLYRFSATSTGFFQIFENDFMIWVAPWGRLSEMASQNLLGAEFGDKATI